MDFKVPTEMIYVAIAAAGGIARYLQHYLTEGKFELGRLFAHLVVSMFSGYMFYEFAVNIFGFPVSTMAIFAGLGGWMGVEALKMLESLIKDKFQK